MLNVEDVVMKVFVIPRLQNNVNDEAELSARG